jgi:hypothetical protein
LSRYNAEDTIKRISEITSSAAEPGAMKQRRKFDP